jgi:hypothetical protein
MPVSSVSGMLSTSFYFVAVLLLMVVIMGPALSVYSGASLEAAGRIDRAVAVQVDDLAPGMRTVVEFGSYPGMVVSVKFSGDNVTSTVNGFSATESVGWQLATCTLGPGERYEFQLSGGVVTLA